MNALRQTRATTTKLLSSASPASNGTRALLVANASVAQSSAVPRLNISGSNSRHFGTTRRAMAMQASNRLKTAFAQGRQSMGMWQMLPGANVSRLLARSGVDWVMVDCEHGNMDDSAMHDAVPAIAALGVSPLVRIPDIQSWMVKRALDSGAHGVLVPLLRSVEQAKELVQAAKFPPMGRRGFGSPIAPERFNPMPSFTEYLQQANDALLTMVQIETREALDVVEDIAAVDGIDVLFIGPFDLGNSIGHPILNGAMAPELTDAIGRILAACRKAGKKCGMYATSGEQAKTFADQGFDMISVAADYTALEYVLKQQFGASQGQGATSKTGSY
ncbi:HpcH/HpaI aldolase/citrate lyase family protein [Purpureocillium lilacinum]|uniref:HpcH/HpaI aldolase/citrate lyase family protein n=1 Tax=Purpureocillium lilacinum TaxID=33203 RepID=A0A179HP72_PURLI|nr:HpcH/HpaI aldolase/citrate lyase family protein [Purpureocillium lilacinum]OAQ91652.1 HpcH/HpaI aldolase/citrate lyase family protein [Purpureocillium lilacinum]